MLILFFFTLNFCRADELHVPDDFNTIQRAVNAADPGDKIIVAAGDYQSVVIQDKDDLTLIGAGLEADEMSNVRGRNRDVAFHVRNSTNIEINGFDITADYTAIWLENSSDLWVHHNYIHDLGRDWTSSISVSGPSEVVLIENNIMLTSWHYGVYLHEAEDVVIRNNIIADMANNDGIHLHDADDIDIYNNIIMGNGDFGIFADNMAGDFNAEYNNIFDNRGGNDGGFRLSETNYSLDPSFGQGYHLRDISYCIDAGHPDSPDDLDGSRADIGALPYDHDGNFPFITFDIDEIEIEFEIDERGEEVINVANEGDFPLWARLESNAEWMDIEPALFRLQPDDDVFVTINTRRLERGEYESTIDFETSDPDVPFIEFPVILYVDMAERPEGAQSLTLREDWNLNSANMMPLGRDITIIFDALTRGRDPLLIQLKNQNGQFYLPRADFNNIPRWVVTQGYFAMLSEEVEYEFEGNFIDVDHPIYLRENW